MSTRYTKADSESYFHYVDVLDFANGNNDKFEIKDLKDDTRYSFAIMAFNVVGDSEYTADNIQVETKGKKLKNRRK